MSIPITAHKQQLNSNSNSVDVPINLLPPELLIKILSYFDELELNKLQMVNRQFRGCVQHIKLDRYVKNFRDFHVNFRGFIADFFPQKEKELDSLFEQLSITPKEITQVYEETLPVTNAIECARQVNDKLRRSCIGFLSNLELIQDQFGAYEGSKLASQLPYMLFLVNFLKHQNIYSPNIQQLFIRRFIDVNFSLVLTTPCFSDVLAFVDSEVSQEIGPYIFFKKMLHSFQEGDDELIIEQFNTIKNLDFKANVLKELFLIDNAHDLDLIIKNFEKIDFLDVKNREKMLMHIGKYAALDKLDVYMGCFNIKDVICIYRGALEERRLTDDHKLQIADYFLKTSKLELAIFIGLDWFIRHKSNQVNLIDRIFDEYIKKLPEDLQEKEIFVSDFLIENPYLNPIGFRLFLIRCMLNNRLDTEAYDQLKVFDKPLLFNTEYIQGALRNYFECDVEVKINMKLMNFLEPSICFELLLHRAQNLKGDSLLENWNRTIALFSAELSLERRKGLENRLRTFLRTHLLYEELFKLPVKDDLHDKEQHYLDVSMSQMIPLHLRTESMKGLLEDLNGLKSVTLPKATSQIYREVVSQLIDFKEKYKKFRSVVFNIYMQKDECNQSRHFVNALIDIFFTSGLDKAQAFFNAEYSLTQEEYRLGKTLLKCFRDLNAVKAQSVWV